MTAVKQTRNFHLLIAQDSDCLFQGMIDLIQGRLNMGIRHLTYNVGEPDDQEKKQLGKNTKKTALDTCHGTCPLGRSSNPTNSD